MAGPDPAIRARVARRLADSDNDSMKGGCVHIATIRPNRTSATMSPVFRGAGVSGPRDEAFPGFSRRHGPMPLPGGEHHHGAPNDNPPAEESSALAGRLQIALIVA